MARHLIKVVPLPAGLRRQAKLKTGKLNSRRVGSTRSRLNPRSVSADPAAGSGGGMWPRRAGAKTQSGQAFLRNH